MGKTPLFLPETNWISSLEKLPKGSLFYLSADFANPTGKRITLDERKQVLAIAEKNDFYIFDDATYRPFFLDHSLPSLVSLAPERVFHSISFSKILSPGLRIAMTHVPNAFRDAFLSLKANVSLNSSGFTQAIVGGWLLKNDFSLSKHLDAFKNLMRNKQEFFHAQHVPYAGGFFVEMTLQHPSIDLSWCAELLAKEDVAACPMSMFSDNLTLHNKLRLAIAKISLENLKVGFMKIHNFASS
jgi:2-aminoadipate transaminase